MFILDSSGAVQPPAKTLGFLLKLKRGQKQGGLRINTWLGVLSLAWERHQ